MHESEALGAFARAMRNGLPVFLAQGVIPDEDGAIEWIDDHGLFAEVDLASEPFDGIRTKALVGGDLYSAAGGALHSRVLRRGEHVVVLLLEGDPRGHSMIIGRASTTASKPAGEVAFREVTEKNIARTNADLFGPGESWHVGIQDGNLVIRLQGDAKFVINDPDGGSLCFAGAGKGWQLKHALGASIVLHDKGITLKSPSGQSFLELDDDGVRSYGAQHNKIDAGLLVAVNMKSTDAPGPTSGATRGTGSAGVPSTTVYIGG